MTPFPTQQTPVICPHCLLACASPEDYPDNYACGVAGAWSAMAVELEVLGIENSRNSGNEDNTHSSLSLTAWQVPGLALLSPFYR